MTSQQDPNGRVAPPDPELDPDTGQPPEPLPQGEDPDLGPPE